MVECPITISDAMRRAGGQEQESPETNKKTQRIFPKIPFHGRKKDEKERRRSTHLEDESKLPQGSIQSGGDRTRKGSPQHRRENGGAKIMDSLNQELSSALTSTQDGRVANATPESYPTGTANRVALKPPKQRQKRKGKERERKPSENDDDDGSQFPIPRSNSSPTMDRKPFVPIDRPDTSDRHDHQTVIGGRQVLRPPPRVDRVHVAHAGTKVLEVSSKEPLTKTSSLPQRNDPDSQSMDDGESGRERSVTPKGYREKTRTIQRPKVPPPAPPPSIQESPTSPTTIATSKPAFTLPRREQHGTKPPITSPKPAISLKPDFAGQKPLPPAKPSTLDMRRGSMRRQAAVDVDNVGLVNKTSLLELAGNFESSARTVLQDRDYSRCNDLCIDAEVFYNCCKKYVDTVSVRVKFSLREHLTGLERDVETLKMKCGSGSHEQLETIIGDLQAKVSGVKAVIQR